ncbi:MAG: NPCBM/NEW2 domain-containing protein [Kiritimatiellae bacterium]|nr:NPCBM/NEW2 domain-containing protein [Kiritimatiellia bacterium]
MKNVMLAVSFGIGAMSLAVGMAEDAAMVVARRAADEQARGAGKRGWIAWEAERNPFFPTQNLARVREIASFLSSCATPAGVPANHRTEWDARTHTDEGKQRIAAAEKVLAAPLVRVPPESFDEYRKTGNRGVYTGPKGKSEANLCALVYGEALENKGRFLGKISDYILASCDEPSWVAPFEGGCGDRAKPLDGDHYIDLTASRTAALVATAVGWFRDRLPSATVARAMAVLRGRIFNTFLKDSRRTGGTAPYLNWWMPDRFNWSAVCHNGCVTAILAVEDDPFVRAEAIESAERLMAPCFLSGFGDDGFCEEGMGYWNFGFGNFMQLAGQVRAATDGRVDFCASFPRAKVVAGFGARYRMDLKSSPPFADGNGAPARSLLALINQAWPDLYADEVGTVPPFTGEFWVDGFRSFGKFKLNPRPPSDGKPLPPRDWFDGAGVLIARHGNLSLAVKGGSNGDRHNHDDAGSYVINVGARQLAGDPGNEDYTGRTFSKRRYESKVLNSYGHPVPRVGGRLQGTGPAFGAQVLKTEFTADRDTVVYDLADAYPAKVPVVKLVRTVVFDRKVDEITVRDEVVFAEPTAFESPVIAQEKPVAGVDKAHFTLRRGDASLDVEVSVEGGEWNVREELVENPHRVQPYRLAVAFRQPVRKGMIEFRYRLVKPQGPHVDAPIAAPAGATYLDAMDLSDATCGAGRTPRPRHTVEGGPISLAGKVFERGLGVHAPFEYKFFANGAATRFTANVGVDDDMKDRPRASVRFLVLADDRVAADSGVLRAGARVALDADLAGAKWVTLKVTDAGDGYACDHADWADAAFAFKPGVKWGNALLSRQLGILTPPESPAPRINGPTVFGVRPGSPILYRLPVTGERPMKLAVEGLPEGATFDAATGLLGGAVSKPGDYALAFTAENARGKAKKNFTLKVGNTICLTPPLGWNSWNCWGQDVTDEKMRRAADAMVSSGLADHGWSYIVVDDCWRTRPTEKEAGMKRPGWIGERAYMYGPARTADDLPCTNPKFPDMKAMVAYIHAKGLKAGLYSVPATVACCWTWGSFGHEAKDTATWADWGVDLLKYDWCMADRDWWRAGNNRERQFKAYKLMGDLLAKQKRDIVYNVCNYGRFGVTEWARAAGGQYWRTNDDLKDTWPLLIRSINENMNVADAAGPGGWNDPDMLVVGPMRSNGFTTSRLTPNEQYAHMSLWAIMAAPLFIGCDLERLDPLAHSLLTNDEVLDIDQDALGKAGRPVVHTPDYDVWLRPLADGSWAIALFNRTWVEREVAADFAALGLPPSCKVRDVWSQKDQGVFSGRFAASIPGHAALLYRCRFSR